jgi:hypothetical protein
MSKPVDAKSGMQAALTILFSHTADVFEGVVEAIADKYKLDKGEMISVIVAHPAFTKIKLHPILEELGPEPSPEPLKPSVKAVKKTVKKAVTEPLPEPVAEPMKPKKFKITKATAAANAAPS